MSLEHFYVISLSDDGRVISCELAGVGTLNSAVILPRQILEIALILFYNHERTGFFEHREYRVKSV